MILGITGYSGVGKDEAAKVLTRECGFQRIAFADPMREILYAMNPWVSVAGGELTRVSYFVDVEGWDDAKRKHSEIRQLLQRLGTEGGRKVLGDNIWIDTAMRKALDFERVVFTDCRFENEAEAIRNAGGQIIRITRPGVEPINGHVSDKGLADEWITYNIHNDGTIEDLHAKIREIVGAAQ